MLVTVSFNSSTPLTTNVLYTSFLTFKNYYWTENCFETRCNPVVDNSCNPVVVVIV